MQSRSRGVNFHQHSDYSWLDGCSSVDAICDRAKELGFKYVAISDHANVAGHVTMYNAAKKRGLIPVLGTELYFKDDKYDNGKPKGYHLCLWAKNETGLKNIWAISSNTYYDTHDGARTPNARWSHLEGYGEGVICSSACLASALAQAALKNDEEMALYFSKRYAGIFDDFFIEIHTNNEPEQHKVNLWLIRFAKKYGYKVVYAVDAHYANKSDAEFHDLWLGCQTKSFYNQNHWKMGHEYYVQGEQEISERLAYLGDDLRLVFDGIDDFLSQISEYEIDNSRKIPIFPVPDGWSDSATYFKALVLKGLLEKVGGVAVKRIAPDMSCDIVGTPDTDRIAKYLPQIRDVEMPVILDNGLEDYFLIVADYCNWAKNEGILVGPGRGSCTASIVCYLLGITSVDPFGQGLYFNRFLNSARIKGAMPDIDVDFPDYAKRRIHEYLHDKYGEEYVCAVGTVSYYGPKSALKDVCRYYTIPIKESNELTSRVDVLEQMYGNDWRKGIDVLPDKDKEFIRSFERSYPELFRMADKMVGLARQPGKHAAGYVISPKPLTGGVIPVRKADDEIICQFDKRVIDKFGFLKVDLLGLRNLTTLQVASDMVYERTGERIDYYSLVEDESDDALWSLFKEGRTLGLFQLEGDGITAVAKILEPRSIQDVARILAVYRPGIINAKMPDGSGMLTNYLERAQGLKKIEYLTPELESILGESYGVIVYQEQIIRIVMEIGGFSEEQADGVRAAIGHKDKSALDEAKPKFVNGAIERGISSTAATAIWSQMEASGDYSFNKAHSLGYATVTYWTAYMKAHYPIEYYAACMSTVGFDKAPLYMREARMRGMDIVPPSVNSLSEGYRPISENEIAFGLVNIKGCGEKAIEKILDGAPYADFDDFVNRSGANSAVMKSLIKANVFREWEPNRRKMLLEYESGAYRPNLFGDDLSIPCDDFSTEEIEEMEKEIMGVCLSIDPFDADRKRLGDMYRFIETSEDVEASGYDTEHILLGRVVELKETRTQKGSRMAFVEFELSDGGAIRTTCFSNTYDAVNQWLRPASHVVISVKKQRYNDKDSYLLTRVQPI